MAPSSQTWSLRQSRGDSVAFRCSDSELHELDKRVELSGLQKQDYILKSLFYQRITVVGNELLYKRLDDYLSEILQELKRLDDATDFDCYKLAGLRTAVEILEGFDPDFQ